MMRIIATAAFIGVIVAIAAHALSCALDSHETCLVSQGLFWSYWVGSFLLFGLPAAAMAEAVKDGRRNKKQDDDPTIVSSFLDRFSSWVVGRPEVVAAALVGSFARGSANPASDVDIVILCESADDMLGGDWPEVFGQVESRSIEDYGALRSLRVRYRDGMEVEFGIAGRSWAKLPLDPGTIVVLRDGARILHDPYQILHAALRAAVV